MRFVGGRKHLSVVVCPFYFARIVLFLSTITVISLATSLIVHLMQINSVE
jgi:hypothetical protein